MPTIEFRRPDGSVERVDAGVGTTVMRAAMDHGVPGIVAECGGQAMCATCHVYVVEPEGVELPDVGEDEDEMLECTAAPRDESRSRLSCQITVTGDIDGLRVDVPNNQH